MRKENIIVKEESQLFLSKQEHKKKFAKWMLFFSIAMVVTIISILINYLVFFPWQNPGKIIWEGEQLIAFIICIFLLLSAVVFCVIYFWFTLKVKYEDVNNKEKAILAVGFTGGFTDTIGVGSFGVITGLLKGTRTIKDDTKLPGTLNVALGVSALIESALFVGSIQVNIATLLILVISIICGTFVGSLFVSKIKNQNSIKIIMGVVLFCVAILMILTHPQVNVISTSNIGDKTSLMDKPWRIIIGTIVFFFLGMIQSFGIGLYAPAMATLSFLGLQQEVVFPIMACGSALCMLPAAYTFIKRKKYLQQTSNLILISAIFGVVCSFLLIFVGLQMGAGMDKRTFDIVLKWLAIAVIFYVSISMLVEFYLIKKRQKVNKGE
ncbi:TSUP family transporter [Spiroplasma endosymbiont of Cantharis rufa]|uniref:TSUP family transporter n=1 Tax=Spiroplasma endosymbiont of Cantharis rufa TaxID=3066279 RepID=UPI0030CD4CED